ncbi:unnamed protein product [Amoebophrya sp. A120]|nr:unnamed protein product [Amoebophrya sp. A120]|eukprot:GSA120T00024920001.1
MDASFQPAPASIHTHPTPPLGSHEEGSARPARSGLGAFLKIPPPELLEGDGGGVAPGLAVCRAWGCPRLFVSFLWLVFWAAQFLQEIALERVAGAFALFSYWCS